MPPKKGSNLSAKSSNQQRNNGEIAKLISAGRKANRQAKRSAAQAGARAIQHEAQAQAQAKRSAAQAIRSATKIDEILAKLNRITEG